MIQAIERLRLVEVGKTGDMCTPDRLRVYAYQGEESGKFYGLYVDHCRSGDNVKPRQIMFSELDTLSKIADNMSNQQEESRSLR